MPYTISQAIAHFTHTLKKVSDTPHLDIEVLLMFVMGFSREKIFSHSDTTLSDSQQKKLEAWVKRRCNDEPIAYITGHKEFWDMDLIVTPDVLIPRPETECLVDWILDHYPKQTTLTVADLGVGSGAIALALAKERPQWCIHATDNSKDALAIAKMNCQKQKINNVTFFYGEWCKALDQKNYDIIVSNPPYIREHDPHLLHLHYEPKAALVSGHDGLDAIKIILHQAKSYLKTGGLLIFEHGYDQKEMIHLLLNEAGYIEVNDHPDLAGISRFYTAKKA